jgi:inner membrane protein
MQSRSFYLKFAAIAFLMVFLLIPQSVILDLVSERASWREQAYQSIGQSWPGEQTLAGPLLVVPYTLTYNRKETAKDDKGVVREILHEEKLSDALYLLPKQLLITSKLDSNVRYRGIYGVPVYNNAMQVSGEFNHQAILDLLVENPDKKFQWLKPYLSVMVRDQRGIARPPSLQWSDSALAFQPGSNLSGSNAAAGMPNFIRSTSQHLRKTNQLIPKITRHALALRNRTSQGLFHIQKKIRESAKINGITLARPYPAKPFPEQNRDH